MITKLLCCLTAVWPFGGRSGSCALCDLWQQLVDWLTG
jgi:hypothetical protein